LKLLVLLVPRRLNGVGAGQSAVESEFWYVEIEQQQETTEMSFDGGYQQCLVLRRSDYRYYLEFPTVAHDYTSEAHPEVWSISRPNSPTLSEDCKKARITKLGKLQV
jgi:hypothetical protein